MHTHQRVLNTGDVWHGCSVHFVTAELDAGQTLAQGVLQVNRHDTTETLAERVHKLEHLVYPQVVEWICSGQLTWENGQAYFHDQLFQHPMRFTI